jgi:RNA polymerase sigma-70 factor (sigma-E family)
MAGHRISARELKIRGDWRAADRPDKRLCDMEADVTAPANFREAWLDPGNREAAVTALYAEHALGLSRLAYIMLGSQAAAEDVVQDAFCGLYRRWPQLSDQTKALGYVRSSVLNGCRSVLRRQPTIELGEAHGGSTGSAESALLTAEARREVLLALRRLPARQREVLTLRFYLDLTEKDIAVAMGIGTGTVRSAAHRGLASLRRALKETS